jgi:hypothetical protein
MLHDVEDARDNGMQSIEWVGNGAASQESIRRPSN